MKRTIVFCMALLMLASAMAGCGKKKTEESAAVSPAREAVATETPAPTGTPAPTEPPAPTATSAPTGTPAPTATSAPTATPAPTATSQPSQLTITKHPTNENNRKVGGTAVFVAGANVYDSIEWTIVAPNGAEYTVQGFMANNPSISVSGDGTSTLSIGNVSADVNGWGAYCTFRYKDQTARTNTAYMYVSAPQPTQQAEPELPAEEQAGTFQGYVSDFNDDTVTIYVYDGPGYTDVVSRDICTIFGEIYNGAECTAYYNGIAAHGPIFYNVMIQGRDPAE